MSEQTLATAIAEVMLYNSETKNWDRTGGSDASSLAEVHVLQDVTKVASFRIIAVRKQDSRCLVNQVIHHKLKYQAPTSIFHQWRNEHRQVFGLNFTYEHDASKFLSAVQNSMEMVSNANEYQYGTIGGDASNGVYQDPHSYYQQTNGREADQDSIGSNGHVNGAYRKSNNFAVHPHAQQPPPALGHVTHQASVSTVQHQQQYVQQPQSVQQRRASQGSSGSTSTNSSGPGNIYATAAHVNGYQNGASAQVVSRAAPAPPPAPPAPPAPPPSASTSNGSSSLPPISTNAPPPPPPPMLKANAGQKGQTLADALASKAGQLRKTSDATGSAPGLVTAQRASNVSSTTDNGSGSKTSTISSTTSMGQPDFLSELTARFKNKKSVGEPTSDAVASGTSAETEKRPSADVNQRPWQKTSNSSINSATTPNGTTTDSPKVHRKAPSGSSLSSQEEAASRAPQAASSASSNGIPLTAADLDRFKQEIMLEVQREITKAKTDIIEALRQELQRR
ncbi:UNC-3 protein4 protein [Aphelenchoides avenae]|nr:UNC-3 protein4 protein [Aphelenchus avenae]